MKENDNSRETIEVYLDLESPEEFSLDDDTTGLNELGVFLGEKAAIGKRSKEIRSAGIFYPSKSVGLFQQAKKLYVLGLYESSIMVCRATAEYIANELFEEELIHIDSKLSGFIVDAIDFRKLVERFPSAESKKKFHGIYDIGNNYIHPKKKQINAEDDAKKSIMLLRDLILSLRSVMDKYEIVDGVLKRRAS